MSSSSPWKRLSSSPKAAIPSICGRANCPSVERRRDITQSWNGPANGFAPQIHRNFYNTPREIPLRINKLEGKRLDGEEFDGSMVGLSLREGEMRSGEMSSQVPLAHMTDVRIRLTGLNGVIGPGDLYAKVVGETSGGYKLNFTSVPSEVLTFLRSILAAETA